MQAANDTNTADDRASIQKEVTALTSELDRIATTTQYNTKPLLGDGASAATFNFQVGANSGDDQRITVEIASMSTDGLGLSGLNDLASATTSTDFDANLTAIDAAIKTVSDQRADLGAAQNRLEHTVNNLNVSSENLAASESRIRDTDMAKEMMSFTRSQILSQAGTAMLAQANQAPQGVLSLLR